VVAFRGTILGAEWGVDGQIFNKDYSTVLAEYPWTARLNAKNETKPHVRCWALRAGLDGVDYD
jgi:hypothetical protein